MRKRNSEEQIVRILKEAEEGVSTVEARDQRRDDLQMASEIRRDRGVRPV
jgi:hypothetical protein